MASYRVRSMRLLQALIAFTLCAALSPAWGACKAGQIQKFEVDDQGSNPANLWPSGTVGTIIDTLPQLADMIEAIAPPGTSTGKTCIAPEIAHWSAPFATTASEYENVGLCSSPSPWSSPSEGYLRISAVDNCTATPADIDPDWAICPSGQHRQYKVNYTYQRGVTWPSGTVGKIFDSVAEIEELVESVAPTGQSTGIASACPASISATWGKLYLTSYPSGDGSVTKYGLDPCRGEDNSGEGWARLEFTSMCTVKKKFVKPPKRYDDLGTSCPTPSSDDAAASGVMAGPGVEGSEPAAGNPIDLATGAKRQSEVDYRGAGLQFRRSYDSSVTASGALGPHWSHNYERKLAMDYSDDGYPGQPEASDLFVSDKAACREGWNQIRDQVPGKQTVTTSFDELTSICSLMQGSVKIGTLSIFESPAASPVLLGIRVQRGDGKIIAFHYLSGTLLPPPGVSATLTVAGSNYIYKSNDVVETYDSYGKLLSVQGLGGETQALNYDVGGKLQSVTDRYGRSLAFDYDGSGRLSSVTDPDGGVFSYAYDATNNLASVTGPDSAQRSYIYDKYGQPHALTGITDENSHRYATWDYDSDGRAILSKHAGDADKTQLVFNLDGTVSVTGALGAVSTYTFQGLDSYPKLTSTTQPCSSGCGSTAAALSYNVNGYIASRTDFNGNVTTYTRDSNGLELTRTEAYGTAKARTITTTWNSTFQLPDEIDEPGRSTAFTYDANGNVLTRTVTDTATTDSRTTTYTYNALKLVATIDGPRTDVSDVTTFAYDVSGNLTSVTNALGQVTQITSRDAHGNPLTIVDPNGLTTTLAYDARQRLTSRSAGGLTTSYTYDPAGLLTQVTQPDGSTLTYGYDDAHRLTDITDNLGNHIHYTLDLAGNHTQEDVYDPGNTLKRTRSQVYNSLSRLVQSIGAGSQTTAYTYDDNGNLLTVTDPLSHATHNVYDALNRLTQVTDPASGVSHYAYDALDQLTQVIDPRGLDTGYTVDALGNVSATASPDSGSSSALYDDAGNVVSRTDAKSQTTTYAYDELNRLTLITRADSSTVAFDYDQGTYGKGHLTGVTDAGTTLAWTCDPLGRITARTQTTGSIVLSTAYSYGSDGHPQSMTLPSGKVVGYTWDDGLLTGLTVDGDDVVTDLAWQPFGPMRTWNFANGEAVTRSFDLDGRMSGHSLGTLSYDDASRITGFTYGGASALSGSKTYGYDSLDRLTSYTGAINLGFSYDANGNRLSQTGPSSGATYTIDSASNRIDSITGSSGSVTPTYDANGSLLTDVSNVYTYDAAGRLATAGGATYAYDGLGQRTAKTVSSTTTLFAYDASGHLQGEYDAAGLPIEETVWIGDTPVAVLKGSDVYYVHSDQLNTPRQIDDDNGDAVWAWDSVAFGAAPANEDPLSSGTSFSYNLRFPGQYYDSESGNHYNYFRDYSPGTGRYVESDPIGLAAGNFSTYGYVNGGPIEYFDINGLQKGGARRGGTTEAVPESISETIASFRVPELIRQIQSYDPAFNYESVGPTGSRYNENDIAALELALKNAKSSNFCGNGSSSPINRAAFRQQREEFWKDEALKNPGNYSFSDLARMLNGKPPIGGDGFPMELHHIDGSAEGELAPMTRTDHRLGENFLLNHPWISNGRK